MADSAMATRTENLTGRLSVDTTAWRSGLLQASTMFKGFAGGIRTGLTSAFSGAMGAIKGTLGRIGGLIRSTLGTALNAAGIGGLLSGGGLLAGLNNIAQLGGTISDLSERTGIAASALTVLREQFRQGGVEVESVTQYIRRMFEALDDPKKANIFAQLGLDQASLARMNPDMAFNKILDGVRKLGSKMKQANVLSDLFGGRQGINLMTLVADNNSFNSAKEMVGSMAKDMDKFAPILDRISDILGPDGIGVKMQQVFFGILKSFSTDLLSLADKFSKLDFQAVGENIAEWMRWGWSTFQAVVANPSGVWEAMKTGFAGVADVTLAYLMGAMITAIKGSIEFFAATIVPATQSLWYALKAAGGALAIGILEGLDTIKEVLPQEWRDSIDRFMRFMVIMQDSLPHGMIMNKLTGTTGRENYNLLASNPQKVKNAFETGMLSDSAAAGTHMLRLLEQAGTEVKEAVQQFEPNAALLDRASTNMLQAAEIFKTVPMPSDTPWGVLTKQPGATPTTKSIWDGIGTGEAGGLKVSLDGNKIEMTGQTQQTLSRIEEHAAYMRSAIIIE